MAKTVTGRERMTELETRLDALIEQMGRCEELLEELARRVEPLLAFTHDKQRPT